jgi:hypothetical protein
MWKISITLLLAVLVLALPRAGAQQTVEEFLKPQPMRYGPISNLGPPQGSSPNPPQTYYRVCTQVNAQQISCRKTSPKLQSGGGKWFGPWYWLASDPPPVGYQFQSASFHLPSHDAAGKPVSGPDSCNGDGNSPTVPAVPFARGNPDTSWTGHKNGKGAWAVCYIAQENSSGVMWYWNVQGQEGGCSGKSWPFAKDGALLEIDCRRDGTVLEPAELDVVYAKISNAKAQRQSQ